MRVFRTESSRFPFCHQHPLPPSPSRRLCTLVWAKRLIHSPKKYHHPIALFVCRTNCIIANGMHVVRARSVNVDDVADILHIFRFWSKRPANGTQKLLTVCSSAAWLCDCVAVCYVVSTPHWQSRLCQMDQDVNRNLSMIWYVEDKMEWAHNAVALSQMQHCSRIVSASPEQK